MPRKDSDSYWFKFYPDKYLGGTAGFTIEMHGAYLLMLLNQWESGAIKEETALSIVGEVWWFRIKHKFIETENGYVNVRMDEERNHKQKISEKRALAVMNRYKALKNKKDKSRYNCTTIEVQSVYGSVSDSVSNSSIKKEDSFNIFWSMYPKKVGKGAAEKAWKKIKEPAGVLEKIKIALEWQVRSEQWIKDNGQFIPHPASYLNQRRWEDENKAAAKTDNKFEEFLNAGK